MVPQTSSPTVENPEEGRGKVAQQWRKAEVVWIPKEENSCSIDQFRMVSLLNTEGKVFFKILAHTAYLLSNSYIDTSV